MKNKKKYYNLSFFSDINDAWEKAILAINERWIEPSLKNIKPLTKSQLVKIETERIEREKKEAKRRENNVIENFENWKDAKKQGKNPPEFMSIDKIDEIIISELKN